MKVLFISDFTIDQAPGGAQISNSLIIQEGRKRGYDIIEHCHSSSITDFFSHYDLVINSNLEFITKMFPEKLQLIKKLPNSIRLEHDSCHYLEELDRRDLFQNCKKTFFLSEYHHSFFQELYGDYFENVEIVYDPINTNIFKKRDCEKEYDVVYCGYLHPQKGVSNLVNFSKNNPNRKIEIFGMSDYYNRADFDQYSNINYHNVWKEACEVAEIFQKCNSVFHSPLVREPFCRMISEAILCGVPEIIGDTSKIGSYLEFEKVGYDQFKNRCENAASEFWNKALS
tara:strand:+ start:612 stop:1463 length:852 start_codon:yes stop_codon:yes gene_type:complete